MFDEIQKNLMTSYSYKLIEGTDCVSCGRKACLLALHVVEFYHPDSAITPSYFIQMSKSRGTTRGSVPVCNSCFSACKKCSLPIATPWVKKFISALRLKHQNISFVIGNGICRHIHVIEDAKSLFKSDNFEGLHVLVNTNTPPQRVNLPGPATHERKNKKASENKYDLIDKFFTNPEDAVRFFVQLNVLKVANKDMSCIASLEKKDGGKWCYMLEWKDGKYIGEELMPFKPSKENIEKFNSGCAELAKHLERYIDTNDASTVNNILRSFRNML